MVVKCIVEGCGNSSTRLTSGSACKAHNKMWDKFAGNNFERFALEKLHDKFLKSLRDQYVLKAWQK